MNERRIIEEINKKVDGTDIENEPNLSLLEKYSRWRVGVTNDANRRKQEHNNKGTDIRFWNSWPADSVDVALQVERYFHKHGMKGDPGGGKRPNLVYIY